MIYNILTWEVMEEDVDKILVSIGCFVFPDGEVFHHMVHPLGLTHPVQAHQYHTGVDTWKAKSINTFRPQQNDRYVADDMFTWWRHQMEALSALLALCAGNSPVTGEFPTQRPVTWSFDVFFDLHLKNGCVNNRKPGDLRRHRGHYDVTVMKIIFNKSCVFY